MVAMGRGTREASGRVLFRRTRIVTTSRLPFLFCLSLVVFLLSVGGEGSNALL